MNDPGCCSTFLPGRATPRGRLAGPPPSCTTRLSEPGHLLPLQVPLPTCPGAPRGAEDTASCSAGTQPGTVLVLPAAHSSLHCWTAWPAPPGWPLRAWLPGPPEASPASLSEAHVPHPILRRAPKQRTAKWRPLSSPTACVLHHSLRQEPAPVASARADPFQVHPRRQPPGPPTWFTPCSPHGDRVPAHVHADHPTWRQAATSASTSAATSPSCPGRQTWTGSHLLSEGASSCSMSSLATAPRTPCGHSAHV